MKGEVINTIKPSKIHMGGELHYVYIIEYRHTTADVLRFLIETGNTPSKIIDTLKELSKEPT